MAQTAKLKVIGTNGQISLGKEYAGRQVTVEEVGDEKWLITGVAVIPKSELWLHEPKTAATLTRSIRRAEATPPQDTDLDALERELTSQK
ncbi:MAG: hypothetical protein ACYDCJ_07700 [Gammaproteobacteria bacterium]